MDPLSLGVLLTALAIGTATGAGTEIGSKAIKALVPLIEGLVGKSKELADWSKKRDAAEKTAAKSQKEAAKLVDKLSKALEKAQAENLKLKEKLSKYEPGAPKKKKKQ